MTTHTKILGDLLTTASKLQRDPPPKLLPSLVLGAFFASSFAANCAAGILRNSGLVSAIQATSMIGILVFSMFRMKRFSLKRVPTIHLVAVFLVCTFAVIQAFGLFFSAGHLSGGLKVNVVYKTIGIALAFSAILCSIRTYSISEVSLGLKVYAITEIFLVVMSQFAVALDFNNNNISMRLVVAGSIFFLLSKRKTLGFSVLAGCLMLAFSLGSRTSVIAMLAGLIVLRMEKLSRRHRAITVFMSIPVLTFLFLFLPSIQIAFSDFTISRLGSDSVVDSFFLNDKDSDLIRSDFFNRKHIWEQSFDAILERPAIGHGIGSEHGLLGARSHNSYLSLLFEGGVVYLGVWMVFYVPFVSRLLDRKWMEKEAGTNLVKCKLFLICYLTLAGFLESSGFGSVSTPVNLLFIFLALFLSAVRK